MKKKPSIMIRNPIWLFLALMQLAVTIIFIYEKRILEALQMFGVFLILLGTSVKTDNYSTSNIATETISKQSGGRSFWGNILLALGAILYLSFAATFIFKEYF